MSLRSTFNKVRIDEEDEFVCACGHRARDYLVKKKESPYYGQQFYACRKFIQDPTRCETRIWFDEKDRVRDLIPPSMRSPRTPRKQVDIRVFGQYTAPSTLKRKADAPIESFDSGLGDLEDNEPRSPTASRSTKRIRHGYADASTQTRENDSTRGSSSAAEPASSARPLPRRRLFDEFLTAPRRKLREQPDSLASRGANSSRRALGPSIPLNQSFREPSLAAEPEAASRNSKASFGPISAGEGSSIPLQRMKEPSTPPSLQGKRVSLGTPSTAGSSQTLRLPINPTQPTTPVVPKSIQQTIHKVTPAASDSDNETYGWDDDLYQNILEVADTVENPRSSPLLVS